MKGYDIDTGYMGYIPEKGYSLFATETEYYEYLEEREKMRNKSYRINGLTPRERQIKLRNGIKNGVLCIGFAAMLVGCTLGISNIATKADSTKETKKFQKYIARNGVAYDYGETIITLDGHIWTLKDAPEFEEGTEVRVLFDSNGTVEVEDDIIIDVTEIISDGYIKLEDCIPLEDVACYFIDDYGYPCFELKDVGNQLDNPNNKSYSDIMESLGNVTDEYKANGIIK